MIITAGSTNVSVYFYIVQDASATSPGEPVTGLLFSDIETGGSASYVRQGAARTDLTLITLASASATHADGGFILVDDTNMPGLYRCDYADATFLTGVDQVMLQIVVASAKNAVASPIFVEITDVDLRDSVRGGMTALPNAAADAAGGLPISDLGGLALDTQLANTNEVTAARMAALTDWIDGGRLDLLLDAIPTTAMRGTDSAALASVCTEARLAELDGANLPSDVDAILADTGTTLDTKLNDIQGATFSSATDSLEAVRDRGDAAWTTGAGGSDRLLLVDTTIATLASQTSFTLTSGSADNDAYNNCTIVVEDVSTATQKAIGMVLAYVGATKTVTLKEALAFTIATTDKIYILAENSLKSTVANRQLDVTATGAAGIDWGNVENKTTANDLSGTIGLAVKATGLDLVLKGSTYALAVADAIWDEILTGATHNIATSAGRRLRTLQDFGVYEAGLVWLDTVNGVAGTTDFENGTVNNPSDLLASAITIMNSVGLPGIHAVPGSALTLAATINTKELTGFGYTLALGGQDINNMHFFNASDVTGVGTAATEMNFRNCRIGTASFQKSICHDCSFSGTVTMTLAGDYKYINCQSGIAGASNPTFTKTAGQTVTAEWRRWANGITVSGIEAGDVMTINGVLGAVVLNGADGTVEIRGTYKSITDNRTGAPTLNTDGAIKGVDVASILTDTAEIGAAGAGLTDLGGMSTAMKAEILVEVVKLLTTQMTESYAADGTAPTLAQALMLIQQSLHEFAIASTTRTVKKLDGSATAATFTLDDATNPTSTTRTT